MPRYGREGLARAIGRMAGTGVSASQTRDETVKRAAEGKLFGTNTDSDSKKDEKKKS